MPRFVILEHDHPELHWDLMLETGPVLRTWRLAEPPEVGKDRVDALAIGDHRKAYLDYEGPVSGNRGTVKRWDGGTYEELAESRPGGRLVMQMIGGRVQGLVVLEQVAGDRWQWCRVRER
jgi:hypothetical protein